uniref:Microsomal triglyceride transfer protein n=2 Tax=Eptatretus burgeri TaxID=7764 RepID=A0A8C4N200_EPTBU
MKVFYLALLLCSSATRFLSLGAQIMGPRFQTHHVYVYKYVASAETLYVRGSSGQNAGVGMTTRAHLSVAWERNGEQLVRLQLFGTRFQSTAEQKPETRNKPSAMFGSSSSKALQQPIFFLWRRGKVDGIYVNNEEPFEIVNLKRGLISLFQLQPIVGETIESDIAGECKVTYRMKRNRVRKLRDVKSCTNRETAFPATNKVLGTEWHGTGIIAATVEQDLIKLVAAEEQHNITVNIQTTAGTRVLSRQRMKLMDSTPGPEPTQEFSVDRAIAAIAPGYTARFLGAEKSPSHSKMHRSARLMVQSVRKRMEPDNLGKSASTRSFISLLRVLRHSSQKDMLKLLQKEPEKTLLQLIDVMSAAQTDASRLALLSFLDFSKANKAEAYERFLYGCAFATRPSPELLQNLMDRLDGQIASAETRQTVIIVIGALMGKLCQAGQCQLPVVREAWKRLLAGSDTNNSDTEIQTHLLALKNTFLPETVHIFTKHAELGPGATSAIAISGLQGFPSEFITHEVNSAMNRIYHQSNQIYEKTVRVAAAERILTGNPSEAEVRNILLSLHSLTPEMAKFILARVEDLLRVGHPNSNIIQEVLKDHRVHNYEQFARSGSSSSFSGFMSKMEGVTSTYNLNILYSGSGILRKSNMDIFIFSHGSSLHATQVSIEAQGLEGLIAGTPDEGEEDLETMASMSPILFDLQLRPITFFNGYADLVTKMWSATGEPTSAVKGSILLIDHSQLIWLQFGVPFGVNLLGALSIDISGSMDVSLWDRQSKTIVCNKGAVVLSSVGSMVLGRLKVHSEHILSTEARLDFTTTVQFTSYPFLVCMQMEKDTFPFREEQQQSERLEGGYSWNARRAREFNITGSEFPLHQDNSMMCNIMYDVEEENWY